MSALVNYKKRSVSLPSGCKDLADLLHLAADSTPEALEHAGITRGLLTHLPRYIDETLKTKSGLSSLTVRPREHLLVFSISKSASWGVRGLIGIERGWRRDSNLRRFIKRHNLKPTYSGYPGMSLNCDLPSAIIGANALADFASGMFREVYELSDNAEIFYLQAHDASGN